MEQAYHNTTTLHPIGLLALLVVMAGIVFLPRRYALFPFLAMMVFIPSAQRIVLGGLDFTLLRIAVIAGLGRIVLRREQSQIDFGPIDKWVLIWVLLSIATYTIQRQSVSAVANRLGHAIDTVGVYFLGRSCLRNPADVARLFRDLMTIAFPVAALFLFERATGRNLFSVFGGVPEITVERAGRLRAQGAFAHPILAGSFFAALLPIVAYRFKDPRADRQRVAFETFVVLVLIFLTASSTPILGAAAGVAILTLFQFRHLSKWIPHMAIAGFILLDLAMDAPVWHLISRIDLTRGSTGWHRYYLIDQTIRNFSQWALVGIPSIESWGIWANDVTNQYVLEAIRGGLPTLVAFIAVMVVAARRVLFLTERYSEQKDRSRVVLTWSLGAMLVVHAANFVAVSYFGEIVSFFYLGLAAIASLDEHYSVTLPDLRGQEAASNPPIGRQASSA